MGPDAKMVFSHPGEEGADKKNIGRVGKKKEGRQGVHERLV